MLVNKTSVQWRKFVKSFHVRIGLLQRDFWKSQVNGQHGQRLTFLDALRFVAAAAVLFQHTVEKQGELGAAVAGLLSPGVFGVALFFIISGFVMPLAAKADFHAGKFIIRRIFRIYPLTLTVFVIIAVLAHTELLSSLNYLSMASTKDWIANLLLVQDYVNATPLWGVTWTLSLEVLWYVLFAFSFTFMGPGFDFRLSRAAAVGMIGLAAFSVLAGHRLPLGRLGMIYAAIFGCRAYRYYSGRSSVQMLMTDAGLFIGTMAICNIVSFGYFKHPTITMNQALFPWTAASLLFLLVSTFPRVRASSLVSNRVVGWLGAVSFSTYLLHPLAIDFASPLHPTWCVLFASVALTYLFSALGYAFVERPGQKVGKWIIEMTAGTAALKSSNP